MNLSLPDFRVKIVLRLFIKGFFWFSFVVDDDIDWLGFLFVYGFGFFPKCLVYIWFQKPMICGFAHRKFLFQQSCIS